MNTLFLVGNDPGPLDAPMTFLILAITIFTSYRYMDDPYEKSKLMFNGPAIHRKGEWYRFLSHGFVHADWVHLFFNSFVLYMFGTLVEMAFQSIFGIMGGIIFLLLYVTGLVMSSVYSFYKHKDNSRYYSLGASGAVASVVFAFILMAPTAGMGLLIISDITGIYFPAFIFGFLYLAYSAYMSKHGNDNIGHDAHYWGSVWGFVFLAALKPILVLYFFEEIVAYLGSFLGS